MQGLWNAGYYFIKKIPVYTLAMLWPRKQFPNPGHTIDLYSLSRKLVKSPGYGLPLYSTTRYFPNKETGSGKSSTWFIRNALGWYEHIEVPWCCQYLGVPGVVNILGSLVLSASWGPWCCHHLRVPGVVNILGFLVLSASWGFLVLSASWGFLVLSAS